MTTNELHGNMTKTVDNIDTLRAGIRYIRTSISV